jgi:hypothetical protein
MASLLAMAKNLASAPIASSVIAPATFSIFPLTSNRAFPFRTPGVATSCSLNLPNQLPEKSWRHVNRISRGFFCTTHPVTEIGNP